MQVVRLGLACLCLWACSFESGKFHKAPTGSQRPGLLDFAETGGPSEESRRPGVFSDREDLRRLLCSPSAASTTSWHCQQNTPCESGSIAGAWIDLEDSERRSFASHALHIADLPGSGAKARVACQCRNTLLDIESSSDTCEQGEETTYWRCSLPPPRAKTRVCLANELAGTPAYPQGEGVYEGTRIDTLAFFQKVGFALCRPPLPFADPIFQKMGEVLARAHANITEQTTTKEERDLKAELMQSLDPTLVFARTLGGQLDPSEAKVYLRGYHELVLRAFTLDLVYEHELQTIEKVLEVELAELTDRPIRQELRNILTGFQSRQYLVQSKAFSSLLFGFARWTEWMASQLYKEEISGGSGFDDIKHFGVDTSLLRGGRPVEIAHAHPGEYFGVSWLVRGDLYLQLLPEWNDSEVLQQIYRSVPDLIEPNTNVFLLAGEQRRPKRVATHISPEGPLELLQGRYLVASRFVKKE